MRVLVLDDEAYRHAEYARRFAGHDVVAAHDVAEAREALNGERFNLAALDHDLGNADGTGRDVADLIAAMPAERRPRFVVVHSFNFPGATAMVQTLKRAGVPARHVPFTCGPIYADTEGP